MSFHIVCDSCTDLTEEDLKKGCYTLVPLTLLVDGEEIIDDETFDQADFLKKIRESEECPIIDGSLGKEPLITTVN